jgi:hypothetical protein
LNFKSGTSAAGKAGPGDDVQKGVLQKGHVRLPHELLLGHPTVELVGHVIPVDEKKHAVQFRILERDQ